jgi:hypothetical protein
MTDAAAAFGKRLRRDAHDSGADQCGGWSFLARRPERLARRDRASYCVSAGTLDDRSTHAPRGRPVQACPLFTRNDSDD